MNSLERLSGEGPPAVDGGVTAYIVYRNEAPQLPGFLAHHRKLGVRRFVFFDHMSTDESRDILLAEPDCVALPTATIATSFPRRGGGGSRRSSPAKARGGGDCKLDPDEYFIYPGFETTPIDRFVAYLEGRGFEAVRGYMLDVFPRRLLDADGAPAPLAESSILRRGLRLDRAGAAALSLADRRRTRAVVRGRRISAQDAAVAAGRRRFAQLARNDAARASPTSPAALIHYKLMNMVLRGRDLAPEHGALPYLEPDAPTEVMRRHSRYVARLSALSRVDLVKPGVSRELTESMTLAERGVMEVSEDYQKFVRSA